MKALIIFLLVFFLGSTIAAAYSLPLPDGTIKEEEQEVETNNTLFNLTVYRSSLSLQETLFFYKETLTKEGFRLLTEEANTNSLYFANPVTDERLFILIEDSMQDGVYIRVSQWKGELPDYRGLVFEGKNKDVPGNDLAGIPRYPGAMRMSSFASGATKTAAYKTDDSKEGIIGFYEQRMPSLGWKKLEVSDSAKEKAAQLLGMPADTPEGKCLYYQKKDNFLTILVQGACCGQKGSAVSIVVLSGIN